MQVYEAGRTWDASSGTRVAGRWMAAYVNEEAKQDLRPVQLAQRLYTRPSSIPPLAITVELPVGSSSEDDEENLALHYSAGGTFFQHPGRIGVLGVSDNPVVAIQEVPAGSGGRGRTYQVTFGSQLHFEAALTRPYYGAPPGSTIIRQWQPAHSEKVFELRYALKDVHLEDSLVPSLNRALRRSVEKAWDDVEPDEMPAETHVLLALYHPLKPHGRSSIWTWNGEGRAFVEFPFCSTLAEEAIETWVARAMPSEVVVAGVKIPLSHDYGEAAAH